MSEVRNNISLAFTSCLTINEVEMRALDAIIGYGADAFLKVFKEHLGTAYIRDHEQGVRSFFMAVGRDVLPALRSVDQTRRDINAAAAQRIKDKEPPDDNA